MEKKSKNKTQVLAYSRRQKENDTFTDIADALPIQENAKDLDKASILRLAINYLKLRDMVSDGHDEVDLESEVQSVEQCFENGGAGRGDGIKPLDTSSHRGNQHSPTPTIADILPNFSKDAIQAMDGFLMVISRDGRILFSSESISNYLGLRQVDVIGQKVQDIVHPQDCSEVLRIFQTQGHDSEQVFDKKDPLRRKFVLRMRCAFTPSVRSISRCSNFKPIFCSCFLKFGQSGSNKEQFLGLVVFCKLATVSKIKEMVVGTFFKSKHALDLSYTSIDTRIRWILGYDPMEMTGLKAYQYFHPQDLGVTSSCHMNLLSQGVSHSPCYRFMTRWGDWVWCRSKSKMIFNKKSQLPEGFIIYTWIVRIAEEDDRMVAILNGDDGEDKKKTYESGFSTSISSDSGVLDMAALTNPNTPVINNSNTSPAAAKTPPPVAPLAPAPSNFQLPESSTILSPPQSAESSPNVPQLSAATGGACASIEQEGCYKPGPISSPPMGVGMMGVAYSPPNSVFTHSPGSVGSTGSPPHYIRNEYQTNLPVVADLPSVPVTDQSFCQTLPPNQGSFALSPPYTPYNQDPTPSIKDHIQYNHTQPPFTDMNLLDELELLPGTELNGMSFPGNFSDQTTSYNQGGGGGAFVGDISVPAFDQIPPISAGYSVPSTSSSVRPSPLAFSSVDSVFSSPPEAGTGSNPPLLPPTNQILSMTGHVSHYCSQSSTPSPLVESRFMSLAACQPGTESLATTTCLNSSRGGFVADASFRQGSSYGSTFSACSPNSAHHVKQNVISETRVRYGGVTPIHMSVVGGSHKEVGPMRGHAPRPSGVPQESGGEVGSISHQWIKNGPLEPVC